MERAAHILGQSILFDNKAGASGMIGAEFVKNQPVDHHTFLTTTTAMVCITRHLQPIPFDPDKDIVPVSRMTTSWGAFAIHPSVPANTVAEFVAYAKANPGKINYATAGPASFGHLASVLFARTAGVTLEHIPYKGQAPTTQAVLAGEVQMLLYSHPLNDAREAQGALPVNSFWLSGCGMRQRDGEGLRHEEHVRRAGAPVDRARAHERSERPRLRGAERDVAQRVGAIPLRRPAQGRAH